MNVSEFLSAYAPAERTIKLNNEKMMRSESFMRQENYFAPIPCQKAVSDYQDSLYLENERLYRLRFAVERALNSGYLTDSEREILTRRFIFSEKWEEIAEEMCYSVQHLHRIKRKALLKISVPSEFAEKNKYI